MRMRAVPPRERLDTAVASLKAQASDYVKKPMEPDQFIAAVEVLREFGIPHEARVVSAHRTPQDMYDYARQAEALVGPMIGEGAVKGLITREEVDVRRFAAALE